MKIDREAIAAIAGTKVYNISLGEGTFLNVFSESEDRKKYQLWIYLADWAITKNGNEVCSSDSIYNFTQEILDRIVSECIQYQSICVLDEEELHFDFTNNVVLEVWANGVAYGAGAEMAMLFCNDSLIGEVFAGNNPA